MAVRQNKSLKNNKNNTIVYVLVTLSDLSWVRTESSQGPDPDRSPLLRDPRSIHNNGNNKMQFISPEGRSNQGRGYQPWVSSDGSADRLARTGEGFARCN